MEQMQEGNSDNDHRAAYEKMMAEPKPHWGHERAIQLRPSNNPFERRPVGLEWLAMLWNLDIFLGHIPLFKTWSLLMLCAMFLIARFVR